MASLGGRLGPRSYSDISFLVARAVALDRVHYRGADPTWEYTKNYLKQSDYFELFKLFKDLWRQERS